MVHPNSRAARHCSWKERKVKVRGEREGGGEGIRKGEGRGRGGGGEVKKKREIKERASLHQIVQLT